MGKAKEHEGKPRTIKKNSRKRAPSPVVALRRGRKPNGEAKATPTPAKETPTPAISTDPVDGGSKLCNAVAELVGMQCGKIAKTLVDRTIDGDMKSAWIVVELSGAKRSRSLPEKKPRPHFLPWSAAQLAAEPPWPDPPGPEEDVGFGGRESEQF